MSTYILKRVLFMIPTLLIISFVSYGMMRLAPGDPTRALGGGFLGAGATSEGESGLAMDEKKESEFAKVFRKQFHLDKPFYIGYYYWLGGILTRGDFGVSIVISLNTPVWELIRERLPVTIKLNLWAVALIYIIAIPAGFYSAVNRGSVFDRVTSLSFFMLYSMPSFWAGLLLIILAHKFLAGWPIQGIRPDLPATATYWEDLAATARHYVLPVICMAYAGFAGLSRYARVGMLEVINQDYIRTARAKGVGEFSVIFKHALRNSLIPLITIFAGLLPGLVAGSIIIEYLFGIPGMGQLSMTALSARDYPVLMTLFGMSALLVLLGVLVADLLYAVADPRITFD